MYNNIDLYTDFSEENFEEKLQEALLESKGKQITDCS